MTRIPHEVLCSRIRQGLGDVVSQAPVADWQLQRVQAIGDGLKFWQIQLQFGRSQTA